VQRCCSMESTRRTACNIQHTTATYSMQHTTATYSMQRPAYIATYSMQRPAYSMQRPAYSMQRPAYNTLRTTIRCCRPIGRSGWRRSGGCTVTGRCNSPAVSKRTRQSSGTTEPLRTDRMQVSVLPQLLTSTSGDHRHRTWAYL
jgi:hypothetical protein